MVLFSDAKTGKNLPQQIIRAELAGDLGQAILGLSELFGDQFARLADLQLSQGILDKLMALPQGFQVPSAGDEDVIGCIGKADAVLQVLF